MTETSTIFPSPWVVTSALLTLLLMTSAVGWLLLPTIANSDKLCRLAVRLAGGMLFLTGLAATFTLQRVCYLTFIPLAQLAFAAWQLKKGVATSALEPTRSGDKNESWTAAEIAALAATALVVVFLFHLPCQRVFVDGSLREGMQDHGYFAQLVIGMPEARTASLWAPMLGEMAAEESGGGDVWYHWGPIFLASAVRAVTNLPAVSALFDVTVGVINTLLVITASAAAGAFVRLPIWKLLAIGTAAVMGGQFMALSGPLGWLAANLPYGQYQHSKSTLAVYFTYKYEAIILFSALSAWLGQRNGLAALFLFTAAMSAPHTVAAGGVTAAALGSIALLLRDRAMLRTAAAVIAVLLVGWGAVLLGGARMAGGGSGFTLSTLAVVGQTFLAGSTDFGISLLLSAVSLPGIIFLFRDDAGDEIQGRRRQFALMAIAGIAGSCGAYHLLRATPDISHVMLFVQMVLVMPAGIWGLARAAALRTGLPRQLSIALATLAVTMGLHDLTVPLVRRMKTRWSAHDLDFIQRITRGQPIGYFAQQDGCWWFSKHGVLGSMLGSRIARLNPSPDESKNRASKFYDYTKPFNLVPPEKGENASLWSLRFAKKIGVRYIIETWEDKPPPVLAGRLRHVISVPGLALHELIEEQDAKTMAAHESGGSPTRP